MRSPSLSLIVVASIAVLVGACGGNGESGSSTPSVEASAARTAARRTDGSKRHETPQESLQERYAAKRDADGDNDNLTSSRYDRDDGETLDFGHAASATDARAIAALMRRYYAAAAADDGASACRLIYSLVAETVAEDSGEGKASGGTCGSVMSDTFRRNHAEWAAKSAGLRIVRTRVDGERARVVMSFGANFERQILLHRDNGAWKVRDLADSRLS
jgi:hypothetical protein